jgi:predicted Zn-dependent peptidase
MLFQYKADLYTKDNLIIVVAGKIQDIDNIKKQLSGIFQNLPEKKRINKPIFPNILPKEKIRFFDKKTEQNHLVISAPGFDGNDDKKYAANVLATIL